MIGVTRRQQWRKASGDTAAATYRYYQSEARTNQSVAGYHTRRADDLEAEVLSHIRGERQGGEAAVLNMGSNDTALAAEDRRRRLYRRSAAPRHRPQTQPTAR